MPNVRELRVTVHFEGDQIWAEVDELPGCFAAGRTMDELAEALAEAIGMYLTDSSTQASVSEISLEPATASTKVTARATLVPC